jgi:hypothetical protein
VTHSEVWAASVWADNAAVIYSCSKLGYLRKEWVILDPTFGGGKWWTKWKPDTLITHDIAIDKVDFRKLPEPDDTFDAVAFDPPYVSTGGRKTSTIDEFNAAYGLTEAPRTPALLQELIHDGMTEMRRVLKPKGILLVKCKTYVSSGKLWLGPHHTIDHAHRLGFEVIDILQHLGDPGPQPQDRSRKDGKPVVQVHTRQNYSSLIVLKKGSKKSWL